MTYSILMQNETTYKTFNVQLTAKTSYTVVVASGKFNYVNVSKDSVLGLSAGTDFANFDEAANNYKSKSVKAMLNQVNQALFI